ncbi:MAG: DJ-1/PfpI family protein [Solobacterium sp.]|nr:DJ-1/PfpI family protein [Solobacterium sp.]
MTKCAIFLADGFETCEGLITVDLLRRASVPVDTVSIMETKTVTTSHHIKLEADRQFNEIDPAEYDVLILPGGKLGTQNLEACEPLKEAIQKHVSQGKLMCAICAAPSILGHMGLLQGRKYTCFPDFEDPSYGGEYQMELAVKDGQLITGRGMGATIEFARTIVRTLCGEETLTKVDRGIQYEHRFRTLG